MSRIRHRAAVAVLALALSATAGCNGAKSQSKGGATGASPEDVASAMSGNLATVPMAAVPSPDAGLTDGLVLPIDAYKYPAAQAGSVATAFTLSVNTCMAKFGFTEPAPPDRSHVTPVNYMRTRYGPADDAAAADGYHFRLDQISQGGVVSGSAAAAHSKPPPPSAAEQATLDGNGLKTVNGLAIPDGGCVAEAKRQMTADGAVYGEQDLVIAVDQDSFKRSQADSRVIAVFSAWSACMKAKGYTYATPLDPLEDPHWVNSPTASQQEVLTAQADVACKRSTNVIGVWFAVETAMQKAAIEAHAQELEAIKEGNAKELKIVAAVLASSAR